MGKFNTRKPWTRASLHQHLLDLLGRSTTTLKFGTKLNGYGADCIYDDKFPPAYIRITVDANNNDTIASVIHELIHVALSELTIGKFDLTLEEVLILALETYIWNYVKDNKTRRARWEKLIQKKLAENPAPKPPTLEELADRSDEKSE